MKAIRVHQFGDPEVMRLEEVPNPQPGAGEVVVSLGAIGVNPVDTYIRSGTYANKPQTPYTPGMDGAGTIHVVGDEVKKFKPGDRVYVAGSVSGTYAEMTLCKEAQVHPLPAGVSDAEGASLGVPYATAYQALHTRAQAKSGEWILVHGATGGVGIAAVQWARLHDMKIIGTGGSQKGRALVFAQGADHVLDHHAENYLDEITNLTGGQGVDVVLEMLANVNLGNDLKILAKHGRVVVIGSRGTVEINPRDLMSRDASVRGMTLMNATPEEVGEIHRQIVAGLESKSLRPIIGQELPLADADKAHQTVMESGAYGKVILVP